MASHLTDFGLPDIGVAPRGFHACHFFRTRQDLVDTAIPFLLAGLKNNERCLWIAAHPLAIAEIEAEVAANPQLERGVASGELRIVDAIDWFGEPGALSTEQLVRRLLDEEERALAEKREGLRLSSNIRTFARANWARLIEYADRLHGLMRDRRIVACSSYSSEDCRPVDMLDVVRRHDAVLERRDGYWQMFLPEAHDGHSRKYASQRPSGNAHSAREARSR